MGNERSRIVHIINEAILSVWDLAVLDDSDARSATKAMANAALARLEFEGFQVVKADNA